MGTAERLMVSRFDRVMRRADRRINRAFADEDAIILIINGAQWPVYGIFETPDDPVSVPGGGEIRHQAPAVSLFTSDIEGLKFGCEVVARGQSWWVTRLGSDEAGRTRVSLASGKPGRPLPDIQDWSS